MSAAKKKSKRKPTQNSVVMVDKRRVGVVSQATKPARPLLLQQRRELDDGRDDERAWMDW